MPMGVKRPAAGAVPSRFRLNEWSYLLCEDAGEAHHNFALHPPHLKLEAGNELIITDEDSVRFSVGETFVLVENDDAETMLEAHLAEVSKEVADLESEKKELAAAMAELKEKLYKKFGNAINLEE